MNDKNEHFESLLQEALQKNQTGLHVESVKVALEWNNIAHENHPLPIESSATKEFSKSTEWLDWWEGIDEIVYLFVGLSYSFIAELAVVRWPQFVLGLASIFIMVVVLVVGIKTCRIFFPKRKS